MTHRNVYSQSGTPIQQSMTVRPADYQMQRAANMMLGVIVGVRYADSEENRSAQQASNRRGALMEVDVLVVQDGRAGNLTVEHVVVPPHLPSGITNFTEMGPRPATRRLNGDEVDIHSLSGVDPYDLDGDWCVVGFIGQSMIHPFVVSWWPHFRNTTDPQTSGSTNSTLDQKDRYFTRINGVETIINKEGDLLLSTTFSGCSVKTPLSVENGRSGFTTKEDLGGSIRVMVKPSQSFELVFDKQEAGKGVLGKEDPSMPQTNPKRRGAGQSSTATNTALTVKKDSFVLTVPSVFSVLSKETVRIVSETGTNLESGKDLYVYSGGKTVVEADTLLELTASGSTAKLTGATTTTIEAPVVNLGAEASEPAIKGLSLQSWMAGLTIDTPFGPLPVNQAYVATLVAAAGSQKVKVE